MTDPLHPLDLQESQGVKPTQYIPPIIEKHPRESVAAFIKRGVERGILRKCLHCGFRRSFDKVACPLCGRCEFIQLEGEVIDTSKDAAIPDQPLLDPNTQPPPQADGEGFSFTPNPDFDPAVKEDTKVSVPVTRPLSEMTNSEIRSLAESRGLEVSETMTEEEMMRSLEANIGGVPLSSSSEKTEPVSDKPAPTTKQKSKK